MVNKMLRLLIHEIKYQWMFVLLLVVMPIFFMFFIINDVVFFQNNYFLKKYFWALVVGMGSYMIVVGIWTFRKKELRDRYHHLLPVSKTKLVLQRWLFGTVPFIYVFAVVYITGFFVDESDYRLIERVHAQVGILFIFIVSIDFIMNIDNVLPGKLYHKRNILMLIIGISYVLFSVGVVALIIIFLEDRGVYVEFLFFLYGILISIISGFLFVKRNKYLD